MKTKMQFVMAQHAIHGETKESGVQVQLSGPEGQCVMFVSQTDAAMLEFGYYYEIELKLPESH